MEEFDIEGLTEIEERGRFWRRRGKIALPLFLSLAALVGIMAWGMLNQSTVTSRSGAAILGKPAPDFTIFTFSGETVKLSDYQGRPVVLNFWASWCLPCRLEAPELEGAWRRLEQTGVLFVGINIQDFNDAAVDFIREFDITYLNGPDDIGLTTIEYGVGGIPVTFIIDKDGVVSKRFVGSIRESQIVSWIEERVDGVASAGEVEGENLRDFFEFNSQ